MLLEKGVINMNNERIILTMKEQRMNDIMVKLISKAISMNDAIRLTGLTERQLYRKKKAYLKNGINSIPHKSRGKSNGKGYSKKFKDQIVRLYKEEYNGWNFYHFNDTLEDFHNIKVSDSFIYNLLTSNGIESPHKYKSNNKNTHPPRERKEFAGELIQVDASKHQWFYGDSNYYYLHGGIDDATGKVTSCFFQKEETTFGYQMILKETIENYGIPECLYTDYRTVFKSTKKELTLEEELEGKEIKNTRFANMLDHIGTDIISTMNPCAKGRIERLWRTFQDRLYNELKKKNIHTIEEANLYLKKVFIPKYNTRFALPIDNTKNRFISPSKDFNYNIELAIWDERKIYHNSYLKYNKQYHIILDNNEKVYIPTSNKVRVYKFLDGTEHILYNDKYYDLKTVKQYQTQIINPIVVSIKTQEKINKSKSHSPENSPWRKGLPPVVSHKSMYYSLTHGC